MEERAVKKGVQMGAKPIIANYTVAVDKNPVWSKRICGLHSCFVFIYKRLCKPGVSCASL